MNLALRVKLNANHLTMIVLISRRPWSCFFALFFLRIFLCCLFLRICFAPVTERPPGRRQDLCRGSAASFFDLRAATSEATADGSETSILVVEDLTWTSSDGLDEEKEALLGQLGQNRFRRGRLALGGFRQYRQALLFIEDSAELLG